MSAKPKWEFLRLCRGRQQKFDISGGRRPRSIAATRRAAKDTKGNASMDGLKADAPRGAVMQDAVLRARARKSGRIVSTHDIEAFLSGGGQAS